MNYLTRIERGGYRTGMNCVTILPSEVIPESQALTAPSEGIAMDRTSERMAGFQ